MAHIHYGPARCLVALCLAVAAWLVPNIGAEASPGTHRFVGEGVGFVCVPLPIVGCFVGVWIPVPVSMDATDVGGGSGRVVFGEDLTKVVVDLDCVAVFSASQEGEWLAASGTSRDGTRHFLVAGEGRVNSGAVLGAFLNWNYRDPHRTQDGIGPCGVDIEGPIRSLSFQAKLIELSPNSNEYPVPQFHVTCRDRTCRFDASPSDDDRTIKSYRWDFHYREAQGRGRVTTFKFHRNMAGQTAYVTLTVTDNDGAMASDSKAIQIP